MLFVGQTDPIAGFNTIHQKLHYEKKKQKSTITNSRSKQYL